jgi:mono/diheme cytochrome c family protein
MSKPRTIWALDLLNLLICLLCLGAISAADAQRARPAPSALTAEEKAAFFTRQIKPILQQSCLSCHSGEKPMGGLKLTSRSDLLKGGDHGPSVVLSRPEESLLLKAVNHQGRKMPPAGKLPNAQIALLTRWVKMGMPWAGEGKAETPLKHAGPPQVTPQTMKFWSYQPVRRPNTPTVRQKAWVRNPIDAFVLKGLEKNGLSPAPPATRIVLLRRAYFDLIGLPPTPEEVRAFLADNSPQAFEKVVDTLLASPHYGEKWGRHWLDLVRFAETNSYERDGHKPNAWRYRDYVIQSFNQDKPYDQFVMEQLAGDEMPERTPERLIATGYYRLGLWDDEPADPKQALYDDLDDIVSTTSQVFLGMTLNCARCHDHKIDPIPQKDYYRFLAFFQGVTRYGGPFGSDPQRPISPAAEVEKHRVEVEAHQAKVKQNQDAIYALESKFLKDLHPVEKEEFRTEERRIPIAEKRVGKLLDGEEFVRYKALYVEKKRLNEFRPRALEMALSVREIGAKPRETKVLLRGNPHAEGESVEPGFPLVLRPPQPRLQPAAFNDTSGRRTALAQWIASKDNPLTARVIVNRIWQHHFGRGIVRTTSDFGFQGSRPTHPELLDWLASELVRNGWRMKSLHRTIMLSNTYRMSSASNAKALAKDPENDLLWRFDMRRLQAEEVRDAILAANGSLNRKMGGPSFYPDMPEAVLAGQSMPGAGWGKSTPEEQCRRSVYIYTKRSLITPIIASFDGPETDFSCPVRFSTTQPTQALGMLNSDFIQHQAKVFAANLKRQAGADRAQQVTTALWRVLQREPTAKEIARGVKLLQRLEQEHKADKDQALALFCVVALNLNEFLYLD